MRQLIVIAAMVLAAAGQAACQTPTQDAPAEAAAPSAPPLPSYREAADQLLAATRTQGDHQSTSTVEDGPCAFAFWISPGGQSSLAYFFDPRQLDLNAVSPAQNQARHSAFSRRIMCESAQGHCASFVGMRLDFIEIAASTAEDMDRALGALRDLKAICQASPPAGG